MLSGARILLTGASGLVGRAAALRLAAAGAAVRALVHRASPPPGTEAVAGDLDDGDSLRGALEGMDVVVHAAARLAGSPEDLHRANVEGTSRLADLARGARRFVLVSTTAVYAPGPLFDADEESAVGPDEPYALSKLEAERAARRALGGRLTVLRAVTVYRTGPCPFVAALAHLVREEALPLVGEGRVPIDFVHADDLASAVVGAAEGRGPGATFNVAGPEPAPLRELLDSVAARLGVAPGWLPAARPGDPPSAALAPPDRFAPPLYAAAAVQRTVSIARARRELGYAPTRSWRVEVPWAVDALRGPGP
ncbi:MAG TPA: NAD-dependent epimerase/dehydratase family protein [Planctomycetota bacterium]|jgi:nucleoside-diphosphate-sugar epimerase|nr:NAD-dependent epimerase/dehydratase family protein [Planctomycetota bacterium]